MVTTEHTRFTCDHCEELGQGIILTTVNGDQISAIGLCNDCAVYFGKEMNPSLITTIESQNRSIKTFEEAHQGWLKTYDLNNKQIKSQKEEIEKAIAEAKYQVELTLGFNQMYTDISLKLTDKNAEIESLKAITELAVKGLKKVLCVRHDGLVSSEIFTGEVGAGQEKCQEIVSTTLSEIARLSHE